MVPVGARVLKLQSETGVWMPLDMARRVQLDVERSRLRELTIGELQLKLDVRQERVDKCREALATTEKSRDHALKSAEKADEVIRAYEKQKDAWFRKPVVWFGVGVAATVVLEVAAIAILGAI